MKQFGNYIVATGVELQVRPTHPAYYRYIVTDKSGMVQGHYDSEALAEALAKGLDASDRKKIDQEMDSILRGK